MDGAAHDRRLERLAFFSDAVFAIALTLLVIELRVPELRGDISDRDLLYALATMIPSFVGFLVSFFVIATFWALHHRGLGLARGYDPRLAWANIWLLLAIVFLPFASAFMSTYYGGRVPLALYMLTLMAAGLAQRRMMGIALQPGLVAAHVDRHEVNGLLRRLWAVPLVAGLAALVVVVAPFWAAFVLALIPVAIRLLERSGRRAPVEI